MQLNGFIKACQMPLAVLAQPDACPLGLQQCSQHTAVPPFMQARSCRASGVGPAFALAMGCALPVSTYQLHALTSNCAMQVKGSMKAAGWHHVAQAVKYDEWSMRSASRANLTQVNAGNVDVQHA